MRTATRAGTLLLVLILVAILAAAGLTQYRRRQERSAVPDEQRIARSLEIIRTSTPENRKVLKVLFYGQSITHSGWHTQTVEHWRQTYPNTVFVVQNRAIGGFASQALVRTTEQDIAAFYPDLIVFQVYGDHRAYEQIIRLFRSQTAADVIVQTDHGEVLPDPPCPDGLNLSFHRPAGCSGLVWLKQRAWNDEMSYHKVPSFASKYGLALEPQRTWWRNYLLRTGTNPKSMLVDDIHPNETGKTLIATFFDRYFDALVQRWNGQTEDTVNSLDLAQLPQSQNATHVDFDGRRLELLSSSPLETSPTVTVDGKPAAQIEGCFEHSRPSSLGTVPDWPALRRVVLVNDTTPETWTATVTGMSADQKNFRFSIRGSVTGDDGDGTSGKDFVSKSGKVHIDAQDWMFERGFDLSHQPTQVPFEVHWSVSNVCQAPPEVIDLGNGSSQYRYVLASGLPNAHHAADLSLSAQDRPRVAELRAYKPPLQ